MHPNEIRVRLDDSTAIAGALELPASPRGVIVFAHGSGSSRFSRRNQLVASSLARAGFATLLLDLLTVEEARADAFTAQHRFDIALLSERVAAAIEWVKRAPGMADLDVGLFGASTGAAAAIVAAAARPHAVAAIVSRGGRPDLATAAALDAVRAPTLLVVGGHDPEVLELNRDALVRMHCTKRLSIVAGATHLFEEPGALVDVAALAQRWFEQFLRSPREATGADAL